MNNSKIRYTYTRKIGFIGATISLISVYAVSSAPIPLYNIYRNMLKLSDGDLSITAVVYFLGCMITLLVFARISNYLGRRPVIICTLILAAIGSLLFFFMTSSWMLYTGRFIQGLSCGLVSSAVAAYTIDCAPEKPSWLGATVTSSAPMLGLALGAFVASLFKEYVSVDVSMLFILLIIPEIISIVFIILSPETVEWRKGVFRSLIPEIQVPYSIRKRLLPAASLTFIGTWAIGGLYQAFSSSMTSKQLGESNTLFAAAEFACMMAPNLVGGTLTGRLKPAIAQRVGMIFFFLSLLIVLYSLYAGHILLFMVATIFAGASWGAAFTGSVRGLLAETVKSERAGLLSTIFFISYCGAIIPGFIVSITKNLSLIEIESGYVLLVGILCVLILFITRNPRVIKFTESNNNL